MSQPFGKSIQDISAAQIPLEGRSGRLRAAPNARWCQEIADRGWSAQTAQGSNKIVAVDARNSEGMVRMRPIAKLRWSAECTRVGLKGPNGWLSNSA
jgi:hypothetical protein